MRVESQNVVALETIARENPVMPRSYHQWCCIFRHSFVLPAEYTFVAYATRTPQVYPCGLYATIRSHIVIQYHWLVFRMGRDYKWHYLNLCERFVWTFFLVSGETDTLWFGFSSSSISREFVRLFAHFCRDILVSTCWKRDGILALSSSKSNTNSSANNSMTTDNN